MGYLTAHCNACAHSTNLSRCVGCHANLCVLCHEHHDKGACFTSSKDCDHDHERQELTRFDCK